MTEGSSSPASWHHDPFGRHELRYWDGSQWTEHVSSHGRQAIDPPVGGSAVPTTNRSAHDIAADAAVAGASAGLQGGGTLFTEPVLVVNQKVKLIEVNNEYAIYDQRGSQIGAVRQVGQSAAKKALRVLGSVDQYLTHKIQVVDAQGAVVLALTRPAKIMRSRIIVQDATGAEVGQIVQQNVIGKIRFSLEAGGHTYGSINAQNWRAWDFRIADHSGTEIARITKTWEGLAQTLFTTADNFVVQIHRPLEEPLRSLVVASSLAIDTALKQDNRGVG